MSSLENTYTLEDYFLKLDQKVVRIKLWIKDDKKIPTSCEWFNNKVPSYSITHKANSLNVFDNDIYKEYLASYQHISGHNAIGIDTHNIYQIDFDKVDDITRDKLIDLGIPYFESFTKKLPHFVFRDTKLKNPVNIFKFTTKTGGEGEILTGAWSYAKHDAKIYNVDIDDGDFIDFDIMGSGLFDIIVKEENKANSKMDNSVLGTPPTDLDEYAECIDIEKRINTKGCYCEWRNIVWALASADEYEIAKKLSMRGEDTYNEVEFDKVYNSYAKDKGVKLGTFFHYCKEDNEELYYKILNKYKKKVSVISAQTHYSKAELLYNNIAEYFINSYGVLYVWVEKQRRWVADTKKYHTQRILSTQLSEWGKDELQTINRYIVSDNGLQGDNPDWVKLNSMIKLNEMMPEVKNITEAFMSLIFKQEPSHTKFDADPYILAFNNVVCDIRNFVFRPLQKEDYITMTCGYDWVQPTDEQYNTIDIIFKQIFIDKEIKKCYLSVLFNGLIGLCPEIFVIANGNGRNGKGLINELMRSALGDYGYELISTALCDKLKDGANPSIANLDKKRFVTCAEPDSTHPLNTDTIKKLTGGGEINARKLYSDNTKTMLNCVLVLEANDKPTLGGNEADSDALKCRMMDILFASKFVDKDEDVDISNNKFKKNEYFKDNKFKNDHRCALIRYILRNGTPKIYKPDCVLARSKQYLMTNDKIYDVISSHTTPVTSEYVKVKDLYNYFKSTDEYVNMNKAEKRKYNYRYFTDKVKEHSEFKQYHKTRIDFTIEGVRTKVDNVLWGLAWVSDDDDVEELGHAWQGEYFENEDELH